MKLTPLNYIKTDVSIPNFIACDSINNALYVLSGDTPDENPVKGLQKINIKIKDRTSKQIKRNLRANIDKDHCSCLRVNNETNTLAVICSYNKSGNYDIPPLPEEPYMYSFSLSKNFEVKNEKKISSTGFCIIEKSDITSPPDFLIGLSDGIKEIDYRFDNELLFAKVDNTCSLEYDRTNKCVYFTTRDNKIGFVKDKKINYIKTYDNFNPSSMKMSFDEASGNIFIPCIDEDNINYDRYGVAVIETRKDNKFSIIPIDAEFGSYIYITIDPLRNIVYSLSSLSVGKDVIVDAIDALTLDVIGHATISIPEGNLTGATIHIGEKYSTLYTLIGGGDILPIEVHWDN